MNWQQKIVNLLTMCRRAGKLIIGFDAVKDTFVEGDIYCIVVANDISQNTLKKVNNMCDTFSNGKIPVVKVTLTIGELERYLCQKVAVAGICDRGFAKRLIELNTQFIENGIVPDEWKL